MHFKFVPSNQTLFPTSYSVKRDGPWFDRSCDLIIASCAADLDSLILSRYSWSVRRSVVLIGWCAAGIYLMRVLKGACLVVALGQEFLIYCAKGKSFNHSCCWLSQ
jgi:hypothetical protein